MVIYDPEKDFTVTIDKMHTLCDHTIWEGKSFHGYPVQTYLRGQLIYDHGQALVKHFNGNRRDLKDVVGLYVVQADCTVSLLVADFDGTDWQRESLAYVHAGRSLGVDVALERSRSGDGAHAWVFFDEPLPSSLARDFGSLLITRAMDNGLIRHFDAYDRFYPAQDTIAKRSRSEERRVGKECRSRWSPYH